MIKFVPAELQHTYTGQKEFQSAGTWDVSTDNQQGESKITQLVYCKPEKMLQITSCFNCYMWSVEKNVYYIRYGF